jgi:hypothetical protein
MRGNLVNLNISSCDGIIAIETGITITNANATIGRKDESKRVRGKFDARNQATEEKGGISVDTGNYVLSNHI